MKRELIPYNVMAHAFWERAPRGPAAVGGAILSGLGIGGLAGASAFFGLTTVGAVVGYLATSVVTSWALQALAPKVDFGAAGLTSSGLLVNNRNGIAPQQFVYGEVRKGGTVTYDETRGEENKYLHRIISLVGHEVEEIGAIYLNDEITPLDEDGFVSSGNYAGKIRIKKHLGDQTTADADLLSESGQIDASFVGHGIAYIYARFDYDQEVFANGVPTITAQIKGKKVYDPRTDTTAYSNNAALCIRDYLTAAYGLSDDDIDEVAFQAAANECDELVELATSGTEKKYTLNGVVSADQAIGGVLQSMVTACAGTLFWGMGDWDLKPGVYTPPVEDFTLDDLRGPISVDPVANVRDSFNAVGGVFNDADQGYITVDYPSITSTVFQDEDAGEYLPLDLQLPFTTSSATAQRLAKLTLYRSREQIGVTANFSLKAFNVEVGDIVTFTNERYGWDAKEFEVVGWNLNVDENAGLSVRLDLRETSEAAFDWNAEETTILANNSNLLSVFDVPTPTLDAAVIGSTVNNDGTTVPKIVFSWTTGEAELVDYYDFQWKLSSDSTWNSTTTRATEFELAPALSGAAYDYRVRASNAFGVKSPFASSVSPASTGDDDTTPNPPSNLSASGGQGAIQLSWDAPTQNTDASAIKDLFQYKVYRNATNNFGTADLVGRVAADSFAESALQDNTTYYYWVTALDYTGNESAESTVASATTLEGAETRGGGTYYIGVTTLPTTSSGAHTDFTSAIGDPVDYDRAWFYTGTIASPTAQSVWIYEEGSGATPADSWNEQEEVIDGDLLVAGTITTDKVATSAITTDKIAAGAVGSVKIADDIQSDNYVADTSGWKIDRLNGNAEFNNVTVRGLLSATLIDASEQFAFDCGGGRIAPVGINQNKSVESTGGVAPLSLDSVLISPDYLSGYSEYRLARYNSKIFLEAHGEMNGFGGAIILQVSVNGGTWTNIASRTIYNTTGHISYTYTTPGSFDTLAFRVTESSGANMRLGSISLTASNW
jgi:hypothetical protein